MSLLGIDVGTTGCKAAVFSAEGQCLASAYREYAAVPSKDNRVELDGPFVMRCVSEVIAEVAALTAADPITALCVSSMGEAVTPVSADRRILGSSILSSDARGGDLLTPIIEQFGRRAFYDINPNIPGPNYSLPKLLWIRKHQPALYDRADQFLLWGDLVAFMLGCEPMTSYSLANRTLLFDIRRECWSQPILDAAGIDQTQLARPVPSGTVAGTVSDGVAASLGLPRGVKVVVGGHDQCCNSLGAGIAQAGRAVCGIGTFECITPTYDHIPASELMMRWGLNVEHHVLPGLYVSFIYNQAGSLVRWFRDTFAQADRQLMTAGEDIYDVLVREMPEEPTGLLTLPYFEMTGPPEFVTDGTGVIAGLRTRTPRGEILKSILEGVTFYFVESIQALREMGIDTSEFIATGGGARNDRGLQIKADIFGIPFVRPRITEGSVVGAAILAGVATGVFADAAAGVAKCVQREKVFRPDPARHRIYVKQYEKYRRLCGILRGFPTSVPADPSIRP